MVTYRTLGLFVATFVLVVAVVGVVAYVVATRQQSNVISSFSTSSPFLVQLTSSQEYLAAPLHPNKKLTTTDDQQQALRLFASKTTSDEAVLLVSFAPNNFLTREDDVWYLDVDEQDGNGRVECNVYNLDTGQGQEWTQNSAWQLTSNGFLRSLRGQGDLFLSSTSDGVEATKKQLANEVRLVVPDNFDIRAATAREKSSPFFSSTPYRIRVASSYLVEGSNQAVALGNKQDALVFKSFRTPLGTLVCRSYADDNFLLDSAQRSLANSRPTRQLLLNTQQDDQVQYLAATPNGLSLKGLKGRNIATTSLWSLDGSALVSGRAYIGVNGENIALTSSKSNAASITFEHVDMP
jgi:hypothetical protein